jgi:hypothetical protein
LITFYSRLVQQHALHALRDLPQKLAGLLSGTCSICHHAATALIANMMQLIPGTARVFAALGAAGSLVALLSSAVVNVRECAALALMQLLKAEQSSSDSSLETGRALESSATQSAVSLGAIGSLLDMVASGIPQLMQAAGAIVVVVVSVVAVHCTGIISTSSTVVAVLVVSVFAIC